MLFLSFRMYETDPDDAIKQVHALLEESNVDGAVRVGDLYGFLIEHFARKQKWQAVSRSPLNILWVPPRTVVLALYVCGTFIVV